MADKFRHAPPKAGKACFHSEWLGLKQTRDPTRTQVMLTTSQTSPDLTLQAHCTRSPETRYAAPIEPKQNAADVNNV